MRRWALRALVNLPAKAAATALRSARFASMSSIRASHSAGAVCGATRNRSSGVASGTPPIEEASTGTPSASYSSAATQNVSMNPGITRVGKTPTSEVARRHWASCELTLRSTVRFGMLAARGDEHRVLPQASALAELAQFVGGRLRVSDGRQARVAEHDRLRERVRQPCAADGLCAGQESLRCVVRYRAQHIG